MNVSHFCVLFYFKECTVWILQEKIFLFPSSYRSRCTEFPVFCHGYSYFCLFVTISAVDWALCKGCSLRPSLTLSAAFMTLSYHLLYFHIGKCYSLQDSYDSFWHENQPPSTSRFEHYWLWKVLMAIINGCFIRR